MSKKASGFNKGVSPYVKHQKVPYKYPSWCIADKDKKFEPLPLWLQADLARVHEAQRRAERAAATAILERRHRAPPLGKRPLSRAA